MSLDRSSSSTDLEIPSGHKTPRWEVVAQRAGWGLSCVILLAALAGLLGDGPLSSATARAGDGSFSVEYQRFERYRADTKMTIRLARTLPRTAEWRLAISRSLLDHVEVSSVSPEPLRMEAGSERTVFVLASGAGPPEIHLSFEPRIRSGFIEAAIGIEGAEPVSFRIFVYP